MRMRHTQCVESSVACANSAVTRRSRWKAHERVFEESTYYSIGNANVRVEVQQCCDVNNCAVVKLSVE